MVEPAILVVDDEAPTRKYLSANLKTEGYQVLTASDGTEALKLIAEHPFDLLLLDIGLPGPDGFEVLSAVRRDMQVPVLVLSARGREADKVKALDLGADDYLTKPFGVDELLARVREALDLLVADVDDAAEQACFEAVAGLRKRFAARPLLVLAHEWPNARRLETWQPCRYVRKPFAVGDVLGALEQLIAAEPSSAQ